jgi:hypothetical protein
MSKNTTSIEDKDFSKWVQKSAILEFELDLSYVLGFIQSNYSPEDIYDHGELDDWAEANGYVKEN